MRLKKRQPFEPMSNDVLVDGYNPADLFQNSDLNFEFVMENDPEDLKVRKYLSLISFKRLSRADFGHIFHILMNLYYCFMM